MDCRSTIVITAVLLTAAPWLRSQVDDLASDPWSIPQLEALQTYRDAPLCLHCTSATVLTSLPGVGRATASRILRAVRAGAATMDAIALEACLSVDQRLIVEGTTTLVCTCGSWFDGIQVRSRVRSEPAAAPDVYGRAEIHTSTLRAGLQTRSGPLGKITGGWALADIGPVSIAVGDLALRTGLGLVLGGGGAFGRGTFARAASVESTTRLRPWTSSWLDPSQRGIGVIAADTIVSLPFEVGGLWSHRMVGSRAETMVSATATMSLPLVTIGTSLQHLEYDQPLASTAMSVVPERTRTLGSIHGEHLHGRWSMHAEVAFDDQLRTAGLGVLRWTYAEGRVAAALRWSDADLRNPYAAPISSASALGNEAGVVLGLLHRADHWSIEASIDLHQRLSRSWGSPLPSRGMDLLIDAERRLGSGELAAVRFRYEADTEGWRGAEDAQTVMIERRRMTARAELTAEVHRTVRLRCRADVRWLTADRLRSPELGALAYAEARVTPTDAVAVSLRHTVFRSPSIDVAPYTVEAPLQGVLQIVAGSGQGARTTLSARWSPLPFFSIGFLGVATVRSGRTMETAGAVQVDVAVR